MSMEFTMYDTLLQLPIFQGMSRSDLTVILDKVKLEFVKYKAGEKITLQGSRCDALLFILSGEVMCETPSLLSPFTFSEFFSAPYAIESYSLFGLRTDYRSNTTALTDVNLLRIHKSYIYTELNNYEIFRINYLNMLSSRAQSVNDQLWNRQTRTLEERIIYFIYSLSVFPAGKKILRIKMDDLADILNETRINVSKVLNGMEKAGLVELHRKEITMHRLENVIRK